MPLAPYAAEMIGNTFAHTDNPSQAAQLLSHAVLGGVLAYVNGGNAASGAVAGAGAEAAALSIAKELYPEAFDADGTFHRDRLSEGQANGIVALSSGIGALIGGISGGGITGAAIDANVAKNAVENNAMSTDPRLNVAFGTNNDTWNGKFSSQFIQKTNKKLGDFTTLLKSDESELTMLSMEYYKLFGAELGVGKFELPNFKSTIDDKGVNIEGGLGYKTIDGRAGFSIEKLFGTDYSIKGGIKGSIGGIGADGKLNVNQNKIGASGQVDFGLGIGADIEVKHDK